MSNLSFSIFPSEPFVDLSLYQYGWERCEPLHSYGPYVRNHYLFHYVISGSGTLEATDQNGISQTYQIKSGQGFMIFPKQVTSYCADSNTPWEYTWLEFDGLRVRESIALAGLTSNHPIYHAHADTMELSHELKNEMLYIVQNAKQPPLHLIGHLYLFLDYLTRSSASKKLLRREKLRDYYIKEALSFVEQNFKDPITVEDMAACCNLNRSYFGKIFRDSIGKSPQDFLITYRMAKASELLKFTELSIGDIGNAVGYPNLLHFSRAFKNCYGVSPRQWRREKNLRG